MKRIRNCIFALILGCSAPVLIWVGAGVALHQTRKQAKLLQKARLNLTCSIDADCPAGYICVGGNCVSS